MIPTLEQLMSLGVAGVTIALAFNYIVGRDKRDTVEYARRDNAIKGLAESCHASHEKSTAILAKIAEEVTEAYKQVGERLGENSEALRDVKSELRRRES